MLEPVANRDGLVCVADSAGEGTVKQKQIATRPWLRPGEVRETVPRLIVTQHCGDGKANQFFLRGFNLDHGTDFPLSPPCSRRRKQSFSRGRDTPSCFEKAGETSRARGARP